MKPEEVAVALLERMNHIESILVTSLFTLLVTTALSVVGAAFLVRRRPPKDKGTLDLSEPQNSAESQSSVALAFVVGSSAPFAILSGYYYFMLAHFYAAAATLSEYASSLPIDVSYLWSIFSLPPIGLSDYWRNVLYLGLGPLLPILLSATALIAVAWILSDSIRQNSVWLCVASMIPTLVTAAVMAPVPFVRFVRAIAAAA